MTFKQTIFNKSLMMLFFSEYNNIKKYIKRFAFYSHDFPSSSRKSIYQLPCKLLRNAKKGNYFEPVIIDGL